MKILSLTPVALLLFCCAFFSSCRKDSDNTPVSATGKVRLEFFNNAGSGSLNLNNQWYKNANGDSFTVSKFDYYISNVILSGGSKTYTEANSYHLLKQSDNTTLSFDITEIPAGDYTTLSFMLGVDSLHNVSGAQTGALDPINGMFWTWATGYIMLKMEGKSPKSNQPAGYIEYHCGGFSGPNNVVKTYSLQLTKTITVDKDNFNHVHIAADVLALFKSPNQINFATLPLVNMAGPDAKKIADNYANMFTITYAGL